MTRPALAVLFAGLLGIPIGVGAFTFVYAKGGSYMTNDPQACANCHIMHDHYDAWMKSSHHSVATCNDQHHVVGQQGCGVPEASGFKRGRRRPSPGDGIVHFRTG